MFKNEEYCNLNDYIPRKAQFKRKKTQKGPFANLLDIFYVTSFPLHYQKAPHCVDTLSGTDCRKVITDNPSGCLDEIINRMCAHTCKACGEFS